jgi:hypothetical protein
VVKHSDNLICTTAAVQTVTVWLITFIAPLWRPNLAALLVYTSRALIQLIIIPGFRLLHVICSFSLLVCALTSSSFFESSQINY